MQIRENSAQWVGWNKKDYCVQMHINAEEF